MSGFTNYLRNKLIDWFHRAEAFTPPASVYVALVTSAPTAATAGTEVSTGGGSNYSRVEVASSLLNWAGTQAALSTTASTGTTGLTSNNSQINFGTAGTAWGTVSHWELYDAATSGNRLLFGTIVDGNGAASPRSIASGDPVSFPASSLQITWA